MKKVSFSLQMGKVPLSWEESLMICSSPLRGEGRERVIKSMAKGLKQLAKGLRKRSTEQWQQFRA
jgi:hypothetical protein